MSLPLWTLPDLIAATGAAIDDPSRAASITGISIDTRSLRSGDLFVALRDVRDGHEFVTTAFKNGAAAALVSTTYDRQPGDGPLLRVPDVLKALENLGIAARARLSPDARVAAVTGSVGKTTTKEMLRACLTPQGNTHAADKSFNNHWGVPLTLARMPSDTRYGVFEIGMNHAGEITPLTNMVRPHVAIITTVEAVHLEAFASVADIAEAKAEIFSGVVPGGTAIVPRDNAHYDLLAARAIERGVKLVSFGEHADADCKLVSSLPTATGAKITATRSDRNFSFEIALAGRHMIHNSLAVAASLEALGLEPQIAIAPLAQMGAPQGRGSRTQLAINGGKALVIDESYNANPASMTAALAATATMPREAYPRRIAVLGDMLELGPQSAALHAGLKDAILASGIDGVLACGPNMRHLYDALPPAIQVMWAPTSNDLTAELLQRVNAGDVVMIKGSNGSRMAPLVQALVARHIPAHSNE